MNTASVPPCAPAPTSVLEAIGVSYRNRGGLVDVAVTNPRQSLHELYDNSKTESMDHTPAGGLDIEVWGMYAGRAFHICLKPLSAPAASVPADAYTDDLAASDSQIADVYAPTTADVLSRYPASDVAAGIYAPKPSGLPAWVKSWLPAPRGIRR